MGFDVVGPLGWYEVYRSSRRPRTVRFRIGYLLFVLSWLIGTYLLAFGGSHAPLQLHEYAAYGETMFLTFLGVQFAVLAVLTPAYVGGAIAGHKERQTLEFLLTTQLSDREIVLGTLTPRLLELLLLLLAGLPVVSILQFLGGIELRLLIAGFVGTGVTVCSLGALGVLCSVCSRKSAVAIRSTYVLAGGYLALSGGLLAVVSLNPSVAGFPSTNDWTSAITVRDVADWFAVGNVFAQIDTFFGGGATSQAMLPNVIRDYTIFHGVFAFGSVVVATVLLRPLQLREPAARHASMKSWRLFRRPRLGNFPLLWKELHVGSQLYGFGGLIRFLVMPVIGAALLGFWIWQLVTMWPGAVAEHSNLVVRWVGTAFASWMLLRVALHSVHSIRGEMDGQTWDALVTLPLDSDDLLEAKWLGSLASVGGWGCWLGAIWVVGVISGGLSLFAVPLLLIAWTIFGALSAGIGICCALTCRTTLRARMLTTVGVICWLGGLSSCCPCCWAVLILFPGSGVGSEFLTPPIALGALAFPPTAQPGFIAPQLVRFVLVLPLWAAATVGSWVTASYRLRAISLPLRDGIHKGTTDAIPKAAPKQDSLIDPIVPPT